MQLLYANAVTLLTPQVEELHRHIGIIMNPTLYTTLTTIAWANLLDPGLYPTMPMNATTALQEQLQLQHNEGRRIYENTGTMDEALKNQVIYTSKYTYLKELKNNYTSFLRVTCHDLLEHLLDRYGKITTAYL